MAKSQGIFIAFGILFFLFIGCAVYFNGNYNLNKIKSKTVGDGQYGTARFATDKEVHQSLKYIEFDSVKWAFSPFLNRMLKFSKLIVENSATSIALFKYFILQLQPLHSATSSASFSQRN